MVGVINPPYVDLSNQSRLNLTWCRSGQTVEDFANAAAKTSKSSAPSHVQGGVFAEADAGSASSSSSSSAAPKSTAAKGAAPGQLLMESLGMGLPLGVLGYALL
jgi:hypothetical protein